MTHRPLVATDAEDRQVHPVEFRVAHEQGIPHRGVHIEIAKATGEYLLWERADGRLELAGGHVDWLDEEHRPESYEEAALREVVEELNLQHNWQMSHLDAVGRLCGCLVPVARTINQVPSSHMNNNEWVAVYALGWLAEWGDPTRFVLSEEEGNRDARWMAVQEIVAWALSRPMQINSALRLFLARRGVLVPILLKPAVL